MVKKMCRIVGSVGRYSTLKSYYGDLIRGFIGASHYDPTSVKAFGPSDRSHKDGWGRSTVFIGLGKISVYSYKSLEPVYVDKPTESLPFSEILNFSNPIIIDMLHSRAGSEGMPINYLSVQPFEMQTSGGARVIFMHNGSVYKDTILEDLELPVSEKVAIKYSDSYLLGLKIAELIDNELDIKLIRHVKKYAKSALNIGIILIDIDRVMALFGSYYNPELSDEYKNYYKIYRAEINDKTIIFLSSPIVEYQEYIPETIERWDEVKNGLYYLVDIKLSSQDEPSITIRNEYI